VVIGIVTGRGIGTGEQGCDLRRGGRNVSGKGMEVMNAGDEKLHDKPSAVISTCICSYPLHADLNHFAQLNRQLLLFSCIM
jgi:hypothetical protein